MVGVVGWGMDALGERGVKGGRGSEERDGGKREGVVG